MKTSIKSVKLLAFALASIFSIAVQATNFSQLIGLNLDQNRDMVNSVMSGRNYMVQVDQQGNILQIIDSGANGSGSDPFFLNGTKQAISLANASTTDSDSSSVQVLSSVPMPITYDGQDAIDYLGADLPEVASNYGFTVDKFKDILLNDATSRIDVNSRLLFVDDAAVQIVDQGKIISHNNDKAIAAAPIANPNPQVPIASNSDLANTFKLHSKPGASKTIYLSFVGYTASNTAWSSSTLTAPAFDLTGNPAVFDNTEKNNIISIWSRVAEDFIPFDVDVTTEPPSNDALIRTSSSDTTYGTRVVITKSGVVQCSCGGVAYVGVVNMVNNTAYQPAWVFQNALGNNEKTIAEAISHEAGHTLGLIHDGQAANGVTNGYYAGHGNGDTSWAPIMGVGYYKNVTQWDRGTYPGANNQQNDFATLAASGFFPRPDDVGNSIGVASSLTNIGSGSTATVKNFGVIETATDVDMYSFTTTGGAINLTVKPASKGPNLDVKVTLYKANGTILMSDSQEAILTSSIVTSLPAGTYYLAVANSSHATSGTDFGYTTYGSLGQYAISGSFPVSGSVGTQLPPSAVITASATTGLAPLPVTFSANNSIGNGNITKYFWTFGDGSTSTASNVVHTYALPGKYTASLLITNQYGLTSTKQVTINVTAPVLSTLHAEGYSASGFISNSLLTLQLSVLVTDSNGKAIPNAVVTGVWSGAFSGTVSGTSDNNGIAKLPPMTSKTLAGASATFTLKNISGNVYSYNPTQNKGSVVTISW